MFWSDGCSLLRAEGFFLKKMKKNSLGSKTTICLSPGLHKGRPRYRRSLHLSKENINSKHEIYWLSSTFVSHFRPPGSGSRFRIRIRIHWLDWIRIQYGFGSETLPQTYVGLNTDPAEFFLLFSKFVGHFCPPGSGPGFRIRIRIHWPDWIRIRIKTLPQT